MAVDNYHQIINCVQTCQILQLHLLASEPRVRPLVPVRSKEAFEGAPPLPPPTHTHTHTHRGTKDKEEEEVKQAGALVTP